MKAIAFLIVLFPVNQFFAQSAEPERLLNFKSEAREDIYEFTPIMPPLMQKPGAPAAYWSYFWEFGDGNFSREQNPVHIYAKQGDYMVSLDATAHYDDGKRAKRKKKPVSTPTRLADSASPMEDVFDPSERQMVAMYSYSKPRAEEEISLIISYRNLGIVTTDGRLHLFYNEKRFPTKHFDFVEARAHYGEMVDQSTSQVLPMDNSRVCWTALPQHSSGGLSTTWSADLPPSLIIEEMLNNARGTYRSENTWRFNNLQAGEKRNLLVSLAGSTNMLRDTNAIIHLEAVFAPFDPVIAPEKFVYEIEIVSSHDPNAIAVSDNRVNYRILGAKKLDYKIQFQNNGEGPASTVAVHVEVPKGLELGAMRPVDWYPKCPICPKVPDGRGCLDTANVKGGLVFTFRNIYLPGSRQKGVEKRDSTKGFVRYRIEADRSMPKLPFRSRAKIVFDKNPPIYTNYTKTGFKIGKSPGLKIGYGFEPNIDAATKGAGDPASVARNSYLFLGASLSPYKSWRLYPQIELLAGIKGRNDLPLVEIHSLSGTQSNNGIMQLDSILVDTVTQSNRGFVSFEVPVLLRKNFNNFFGIGIGGSARIILENGENIVETAQTNIDWEFMDGPTGLIIEKKVDQSPVHTNIEKFKASRFRYSLFADVTLGSVRVGPNLGLRGGFVFGEKGAVRPFAQLSLEMKL